MDDPWGSPWDADDSQLKLDLPAPPPRIHTPQTPQKTASPWAPDDEEDVWGGWNAPDGGGGAESPGWGRSPARSPARSPRTRPARSGTVSRHISPEPWARIEIPETKADVPGKHVNDRQESLAVDSAISLSEQPFALDLHPEPAKDQPDSARVKSENLESTTLETASAPLEGEASEHESESDDPGSPNVEPSRAVTTSERPGPARQASKVQELVDMYDGIARRKDSSIEPLVAGPRMILIGGDAANDDAEDAVKPTAAAPDSRTTKAIGIIDNTHDEDERQDKAALAQVVIDEQEVKKDKSQDEERQEHSHAPGTINTASTFTKVPSISYSFDLAQLNELFPATSEPTAEPEPVPDVIIDDTFASISERKAWYRISRFGPMRQHNLGNDEDYVRLDWRVSEVRSRTLRTVRRWMEEDSITGRTVLGRRIGPGGASMFNWNSQAPQVEIGELLGKRGHERSVSGTSRGSRASLASPSSATFAWSADIPTTEKTSNAPPGVAKNDHRIAPPLGIPSRTAVSFGWSTSPQEDVGVESGKSGPALANSSRKVPPPIAGPPTRNLESMDSIIANGNGPEPSWAAGANGSEDEDDWGEMVSSPTWPSETTAQKASGVLSAPEPARESSKDKAVAQPSLLTHDKEADGVGETSWTDFSASSAFAAAWNADNLDTPTSAVEPETPRPWTTLQNDQSQSLAVVTPITSALPGPDKPGSLQPKVMPPTQSFSMSSEDEMVVASILNGLPDLSYMLR